MVATMSWSLVQRLVVCILVANTRFAQGLKPPFTNDPDNPTYVALGSDVKLEWDFPIGADFEQVEIQFGDQFEVLIFKTRDGTVAVNPGIVVPNNLTNRVTLTGSATFGISNVQLTDTKYKYSCSYVRTGIQAPTTESAIQLVVKEPAENVTVTPKCQSKKLGDTATLECKAHGVPPPTLYWKDGRNKTVEDGNNIEITNAGGESRLTFKSLISSNRGIYTCKVDDTEDKDNYDTGVIVVSFSEARGPVQSTMFVVIGMTVSLVCPLYGFPEPYITWTYPNGSSKSPTFITSLFFTVTDKDIGTYSCSGSGKTFYFKVEKPPHPPSPPSSPSPPTEDDCTPEVIALAIVIAVLIIIIIILAVFLWKAKKEGKSTSRRSERLELKGSQTT